MRPKYFHLLLFIGWAIICSCMQKTDPTAQKNIKSLIILIGSRDFNHVEKYKEIFFLPQDSLTPAIAQSLKGQLQLLSEAFSQYEHYDITISGTLNDKAEGIDPKSNEDVYQISQNGILKGQVLIENRSHKIKSFLVFKKGWKDTFMPY